MQPADLRSSPPHTNAWLMDAKPAVAGAVGGLCSVITGHPLDTLKTMAQSGLGNSYGAGVLRHGGLRSLFAGMGPPLVGVAPIMALYFAAYDAAKARLRVLRDIPPDARLVSGDIALAGALSSVPAAIFVVPGERLKCVLQVAAAAGAASGRGRLAVAPVGPLATARRLLRAGGLRSLYRGAFATMLRDGAGSAAYFSSYDALRRALPPGALAVAAGGGLAGIAHWLVALPADVVKSRIQTHDVLGGAAGPAGSRIIATARLVVAERGLVGLYSGSAPALLRAVVANAACWSGYEAAASAIDAVAAAASGGVASLG